MARPCRPGADGGFGLCRPRPADRLGAAVHPGAGARNGLGAGGAGGLLRRPGCRWFAAGPGRCEQRAAGPLVRSLRSDGRVVERAAGNFHAAPERSAAARQR